MPWMKIDVEEQKVRFAVAAARREKPLSTLCEEFGISRPTGYRWWRRYEEAGLAGLSERRGPAHLSFCFLELSIKVAAPPFVIFERWEAQAPRPHRIEFLLHWKLEAPCRSKVMVRASHPSKTAMGGAASVW